MQAVVKAVLSFMLTTWTYSEAILVFPEIDPFTKKIVTALTIPTHKEWRIYNDKEYQAEVNEDLNSFLLKVGVNVESDESDDFSDVEELLKMPESPEIYTSKINHVSIFENSNLPKRLYQKF